MCCVKHYIPSSFLKEHHFSAESIATKYSMSLAAIYSWKKAAKNRELLRFKPGIYYRWSYAWHPVVVRQ